MLLHAAVTTVKTTSTAMLCCVCSVVLPRRVLFDNSQKEPQDATRRRRRRLCDIKLCRQWLLRERRERRRLRLRTAALCIVPFTTVKNHDKSKFTLLPNIEVERAKRVRLGKNNCNTNPMPILFIFSIKDMNTI